MPSKVAFITGANGITGTALIEHLAAASSDEWSNIIATSLSPLQSRMQDSRVSFIPLDFTKGSHELIQAMKETCSEVTHAYFSSYVHNDDFKELNAANARLFENFLDALIAVAPRLECCVLQTGGKHYNVHLGPVPSPAREAEPRRESPIGNFYFHQEDYLIERQRGKSWRWNVIRPEAIIGHTVKPNGMNEALTIALYFLVCKELGTEAPMPTNQIYFEGYDDVSDARLIADLTVWASTHEHAGNEAFNVTNGDYFSWKYLWPRLAHYLGVQASSDQVFKLPRPTLGTTQLDHSFVDWAKGKDEVWNHICDRAGSSTAKATWKAATWGFQDWVFQRGWCATLSINKAREFGWTGHLDSFTSFTNAFESFVQMGQIPALEQSANGTK
ncbi:hypothetical protein B0J13DRAFT_639028 [Dactylonectria estremocensis]|uniref:PRISE-like Rossmann-fold domain-containing protein n=1 Tax=Dactylonectria estremocensis TaxID=1079267 RepID=A0A9P9EMQ9_9HYPO|nr:hypothetical protein B0J13DRAFT_639028 [Dactylonectria estremocensis]